MTAPNTHPFDALTPEFIMDAVESQGYLCDGRIFALNSYENRVYQVGIEGADPLIAKFYRPNRWSREQILEEHEFCYELVEAELPVVAPLRMNDGETLPQAGEFHFSLFPRKGGHAPELDNFDSLLTLGRLLARIHAVGAVKPFQHRPRIDTQSFGRDAVALVREQFVPSELRASYDSLTRDLLQALEEIIGDGGDYVYIRTHGDCHVGNILWRDDAAHFVDFDDTRMAPAIQDLWMLLSGDRPNRTAQLVEIVEGYNEFYDFRPSELRLVEALRTLRMLNYCAWLASRWSDPAFPRNFPWFNSARYWGDHILELREQLAALNEEPLRLPSYQVR
ncbi:putative homoserine kinase type II (protein kinase fold) [Hahella chejuensis KCTC 2396]|uniref:Stress response kinase A n=1 Tax=Hahella chejuensis (strain KCTC 2396) TaxID=349521 RepID=Q2SQN6_HAHCH|nr:serine/threonine protein kinase [Hahella chejuensis]ABC27038.1 putative homoserine kinase type II (protein kinase fold) [Hahella chejuensis KCTC 2396]